MRMHRETYYVCAEMMLGRGRGNKMTHTRLSFGPMEDKRRGKEDTMQGYLGKDDATEG